MDIETAYETHHRELLTKARFYCVSRPSEAEDLEAMVWVKVLQRGWEGIDQRSYSMPPLTNTRQTRHGFTCRLN